MKKWLALLVLALAVGLVVAGCGEDAEDQGSGDEAAETEQQQDTGGTTDTAAGTDTGGGGGQAEVMIGDNFFEPQRISVAKGTEITWTNEGQVPHTVTKTRGEGEEFDSGSIEPGGDFSVTVREAGRIDYVCTIHPGQAGSIEIE